MSCRLGHIYFFNTLLLFFVLFSPLAWGKGLKQETLRAEESNLFLEKNENSPLHINRISDKESHLKQVRDPEKQCNEAVFGPNYTTQNMIHTIMTGSIDSLEDAGKLCEAAAGAGMVDGARGMALLEMSEITKSKLEPDYRHVYYWYHVWEILRMRDVTSIDREPDSIHIRLRELRIKIRKVLVGQLGESEVSVIEKQAEDYVEVSAQIKP